MTPPDAEIAATEPEAPQAPPDVSSLSEHREAFPPPPKRGAVPPGEVDSPVARERHRSRAQTAPAKDVEQIAEYTKRLRTAEDEFVTKAGLKIERKTGESERAFNLRKRAEIAEARRDAAPIEKKAEPLVSTPPPRPAVSTSAFTEKEPTLDQFHGQPDAYAAHLRALTAFDARKAAFDAQQTSTRTSVEDARNKWVKDTQEANTARVLAHFEAHPDDKAAYETHSKLPVADQISLTPVMRVAIETHGHGPQFMLELIRHPEFADEQALLTNGQYAFDSEGQMNPAVAILQRRLLARVLAVKTGAAAPARPVLVAPRPPTPVRASATNAAESRTPDPESRNLAEHRAKFRP